MVGGLPELGCKLREVGAATAQTLSNLAVSVRFMDGFTLDVRSSPP